MSACLNYALDICQLGYLGGGTNAWGGWCRPLNSIDFESRPSSAIRAPSCCLSIVFGLRPPSYGRKGLSRPEIFDMVRQFDRTVSAGLLPLFQPNRFIEAPQSTDLSQFHKFGLLWVPATDTTQGYLQYYFDGVATGDKITWDKYTDQPPPPGKAAWTFGVVDQMHFVLILGTGNGQPMTIRSVDVWQSSPAQNLQN
jgi:hypothetical protein